MNIDAGLKQLKEEYINHGQNKTEDFAILERILIAMKDSDFREYVDRGTKQLNYKIDSIERRVAELEERLGKNKCVRSFEERVLSLECSRAEDAMKQPAKDYVKPESNDQEQTIEEKVKQFLNKHRWIDDEEDFDCI